MESELYALQAVAQEMVAVGRFVGRVMRTIGKGSKDSMSGALYSDTGGCLKLLRNLDVPRRSRHLGVKLEWIKELVNRGRLELSFLKRTKNPSDLLTKCLGTSAFEYHRSCAGFEVVWQRERRAAPFVFHIWATIAVSSCACHPCAVAM